MQMRTIFAFTISLLVLCSGSKAGQLQHATQGDTGTIYGRFVAAYCACGVAAASVYVMTLSQSKRPRGIEEEAYARAHAPGVDENHAESIEWNDLDRLVDLVPQLPRVAMTNSDRNGRFVLRSLPAGKRYYVVAFVVREDGMIFAAGDNTSA
jgi:hypothetical protein